MSKSNRRYRSGYRRYMRNIFGMNKSSVRRVMRKWRRIRRCRRV